MAHHDVIITTDKQIKYSELGYIFWADHKKNNRIRCLITQETVDDYFYDNASKAEAIKAIEKNWSVIWPIFQDKIASGQIDIIPHDNGPTFTAGRDQEIRQVKLQPRDFDHKDFRE